MNITDDTPTAAKARVIIRRAARSAGLGELPPGTQATTDDLRRAALACPDAMLRQINATLRESDRAQARADDAHTPAESDAHAARAAKCNNAVAIVCALLAAEALAPAPARP